MNIRFSLTYLLFFILFSSVTAQNIDLLRLEYNENQNVAEQIGATVSEDGTKGAFYFNDGVIKIIDFRSGRITKKIQLSSSDIFDAFFTPKKEKLIVFFDDRFEVIHLKTNKTEKFRLSSQPTLVRPAPNKMIFAIGLQNASTLIYEMSEFKLLTAIPGDGKYVSGLDFSKNEQYLAIGVLKGHTRILETSTWNLISETSKQDQCASFHFSDNTVYMSLLKSSVMKKYLTYGLAQPNAVLAKYSIGSKNIEKLENVFRASDLLGFYNISSKSYDVDLYSSGNKLLSITSDDEFLVKDLNSDKIIYTTKNNKKNIRINRKEFGVGHRKIFPLFDGESFLVTYNDGNVSLIYNINRNETFAFLYMESQGQKFATIARDGRIDGDFESISKLYWTKRNSKRSIPLESTFEKYYTPNLLSQLMSGKDEFSTTAVSKESFVREIGNIPVLSMAPTGERDFDFDSVTTTQKILALTIRIDSLPESAKEIRLFHNGKLTKVINATGASEYTVSTSLNQALGKVNYFYSLAINKDGIESSKAKLIVIYDIDKEVSPRLFALIIGINNYKNPKYKLNYALTDAKSIEKKVLDINKSLYESINVTTMYDEQFTKENLKGKIEEIATQMNEQDLFLFYYAGHGTMSDIPGTSSEFYIIPYDVTQLYGSNDQLATKAISASEIKEMTIKLNAQKQVFVIDACHSAAALGSVAIRGAAEERAIAQLARSTGTFWLTAAGSEQYATEFEQIGHGVFTYSILEVLDGKDPNSSLDGTITVRELSAFVEQRVPELSEQYKGQPQYPSSFSFGNDFPLNILDK